MTINKQSRYNVNDRPSVDSSPNHSAIPIFGQISNRLFFRGKGEEGNRGPILVRSVNASAVRRGSCNCSSFS